MDATALLETIERDTGPDPRWAVIWLHGLGADGNDFVPLVPELVRREWPAIRFVFPHAPVRPVTINGGVPMRAWYDIRELDLANRADEQGVAESVAQVEALIAREGERGIPPGRIILAGFSQGGAVTLAAGLRRPARGAAAAHTRGLAGGTHGAVPAPDHRPGKAAGHALEGNPAPRVSPGRPYRSGGGRC